jgi:Phage integrase family
MRSGPISSGKPGDGSPQERSGAIKTLSYPHGQAGALDAANVRREFRGVCKAAGIGEYWTPRELRHSFVSLMSSSGVPVEEIARIAGHSSARTTEVVYRRELRPILTTGAEAMDRLFNPVRPNLRGGAVVVGAGDPAPNPCREFHRAASISNTSRGAASSSVVSGVRSAHHDSFVVGAMGRERANSTASSQLARWATSRRNTTSWRAGGRC